MGPKHHEERLRSWAVKTGKPVISLDYGKAPECRFLTLIHLLSHLMNETYTDPYPFAIDEIFDAYQIIVESKGKVIGMAGEDLDIVLSGDSAYVQHSPPAGVGLSNLDPVEVAWLRAALLGLSSTISSCRIPHCHTLHRHPVHLHLFPSLWLSC